MNNVTTVGLDLAKSALHLVRLDEIGEITMRRKLRRSQLESSIRKLPNCALAMEACGSAHFWGGSISNSNDSPLTSSGSLNG